MSLSGLLPLLYDQPGYGALARAVASGENVRSSAPLDAARPYLLAALHADVTGTQGRPVILVTPRPDRARQLYEGLLAYSPPGTPLYLFPAPDLLPYERIAPDPTIVGERLRVLASLGANRGELADIRPAAPVIVTSVLALMQPTMAPDDLAYAVRRLRRGERVNLHDLLGHLVDLGYEPVAMVDAPGQFSRRGGIVDIYAPTSTLPIRIEFFGDEVDSIRVFNPLTQRSERQAEGAIITPACEIPLWRRESAVEKLREIGSSSLREEVREEWEAQLQRIEMGESFEGMELFAPYYTWPPASLADYLAIWTNNDPADGGGSPLLVLDDPDLIALEVGEIERQAADLYRGFVDNGELPPGLLRPYLEWNEVATHGRGLPILYVGGAGEDPGNTLEAPRFEMPSLYAGRIDSAIEDIADLLAGKARIVIVSQQSARLRELLEEADIYPTIRKGSAFADERRTTNDDTLRGPRTSTGLLPKTQAPRAEIVGVEQVALSAGGKGIVESLTTPPSLGSVHLLQGTLAGGWRLPQFGQSEVVMLTDAELFGRSSALRRQAQGTPARRANAADAAAILREKMLLELQVGDYVVHVEHGIAKYGGLVRMDRDGVEREYMLLLYAENDRLYVPADQTDRVAPYIGAGPPPHLHRLGTQEWSRTKRKVRESAELLAKELLNLYAARETAPGHAYPQDTPWQIELEDSFPYVETPDQLRAIEEVKTDMEVARPMDRLICGDVGYGKTEVALRAAFKAVMDGRQVGVLVPTTVLAQQHYNTFSERLAAFPVKVGMLSRFRSRKEQEQIIKDLEAGQIDILVGTHMLLSKNVHFKNLGLVVIDEEQRFGVRHKERLKQLRSEVDVITLSATPIPRTLYMAVSGVRDLSLIETPPESRLPIKTYVTAFRPQLVREVILRELERGGQVFFVHNRVETIDKLLLEMEALVPEARFIVGHGQMPEHHLEKVMQRFVGGDADVLLCTTIIESGLDIPNANTLVVDHADKLGLAQLYQLRGRVGRGANRAYAYFLYHAGRKVTDTARERLSVIEQATELGAGFRIALKDLEIRGAGNLLGPEQSGHVAAIGLDLYTRLLATAVEKARAERGRKAKEDRRRAAGEDEQWTAEDEVAVMPVIPQGTLHNPDLEEPPTVSLDLPLTAYLPEEYVPDDAVRLRMYQRMAASMSESQIKDLRRELEDRFGALPEPASNLLEVLRLKGLAVSAGVESIRALAQEITVQTPQEEPIPQGLRLVLQRKFRNFVKVSPHQVRIDRAKAGERWGEILTGVLETMGER